MRFAQLQIPVFIRRPHLFFKSILRALIRFYDDQCTLHASSLTFISLMSMVPTLAIMFSVVKGLGAYERFEKVILEKTSDLPPGVADIIHRCLEFVSKTNFTALGVLGCALIFFTAVGVIGKIEKSFNAIWRVRKSRSLLRKFCDYLIILLTLPFLVLLTSSLTAALNSTYISNQLIDWLGPLYPLLTKSVGPVILGLAYSFLFNYLPNTKVRLSASLFSGFIIAILWLVLQTVFIKFQIKVGQMDLIYASFSSIPLFLTWLYSSWLLVLFGAELTFSLHNPKAPLREKNWQNQPLAEVVLGIAMSSDIFHQFTWGKNIWQLNDFCERHGVSLKDAERILDKLIEKGVLVRNDQNEMHYLPCEDPKNLNLKNIEEALTGQASVRASFRKEAHLDKQIGLWLDKRAKFVEELGDIDCRPEVDERVLGQDSDKHSLESEKKSSENEDNLIDKNIEIDPLQ